MSITLNKNEGRERERKREKRVEIHINLQYSPGAFSTPLGGAVVGVVAAAALAGAAADDLGLVRLSFFSSPSVCNGAGCFAPGDPAALRAARHRLGTGPGPA